MMKEICVIGYPSHIGGADTELDHQIHVSESRTTGNKGDILLFAWDLVRLVNE